MSTTPVNVQIPADAQAPVIADFVEHALRIAYIERAHLLSLPNGDWDIPGIYILLTCDGSDRVYVGQARKIRTRLIQHNSKERLPWRRAIAVKRDTTDGFNTAEIGYLEGRVAAEIAALSNITVVEGKTSGDETLPNHMMISLDSFVKSILGALRLAGVTMSRKDPDGKEDQAGNRDAANGRASFSVSVGELVSSGLLRAGEALYLKQGGVEAVGSVTADGEILVRGVAYRSPSSAAANALQLRSSNGWTTWRVGMLSGPTLDSLRQQWLAQQFTGTKA